MIFIFITFYIDWSIQFPSSYSKHFAPSLIPTFPNSLVQILTNLVNVLLIISLSLFGSTLLPNFHLLSSEPFILLILLLLAYMPTAFIATSFTLLSYVIVPWFCVSVGPFAKDDLVQQIFASFEIWSQLTFSSLLLTVFFFFPLLAVQPLAFHTFASSFFNVPSVLIFSFLPRTPLDTITFLIVQFIKPLFFFFLPILLVFRIFCF